MLEETSFAIQPGTSAAEAQKPVDHDIGELTGWEPTEQGAELECARARVRIRFYRPDIVRVTMDPFRPPRSHTTPAVVLSPQSDPPEVGESAGGVTWRTEALSVHARRSPCRLEIGEPSGEVRLRESDLGMAFRWSGEVIGYKDCHPDDHFYGLGEKAGFLDKRGERLRMWNSDVYAPHNPETDALYQSIPFFLGLRNGRAYGLYLDNSFASWFDFQSSSERYSFGAEGGPLDYYFLAGPTPKAVVEQYTALTGRLPIPPKWALGYHQSRYSYETEKEVRDLVATFRRKGIPLDCVHLDIHYMRQYRVFTFDRDRFPDPNGLVGELKAQGVQVVPIVDPGVKQDPEDPVYAAGIRNNFFCKYIDGTVYHGPVWPGPSAFPDFTAERVRRWWGERHAFYTEAGMQGVWNDMNEPAVFNETKTMDTRVMHESDEGLRPHREMHNLYGLQMSRATYHGLEELLAGRRPFVLTRAGFAGVQRYAAVWTGDNRSFWEHLEMALPMVMNLGLSGVSFAGPDVGGFAHDCTGQLLTRWTQVGAFFPFFRNHSALGTVRQEPWSFGRRYERIIRRYIELRYEWLPYLYTLFEEATRTGLPILRPLFLEYPEDPQTWNLSDQFLVGDRVLIAPVLRPDTPYRAAYLPSGEWVDYWRDRTVPSGRPVMLRAPLDTLPILIRSGSIIPHTDPCPSTASAAKRLIFHYYPKSGESSAYTLYDDDGETFAYRQGRCLRMRIECSLHESELRVDTRMDEDGYPPPWTEIRLVGHRMPEGATVRVNGRLLSSDEMVVDRRKRRVDVPIALE